MKAEQKATTWITDKNGNRCSPGAALARARWSKPGADRDQPRRAGKLGGRPKKITACKGCGARCGVVEMRAHLCPVVAQK